MHAENLQTINNIHWPSLKGRKFIIKEIKKKNKHKKLKKNKKRNIISKRQFGGRLRLKFRSFFLKNEKITRRKESFSNILGEVN